MFFPKKFFKIFLEKKFKKKECPLKDNFSPHHFQKNIFTKKNFSKEKNFPRKMFFQKKIFQKQFFPKFLILERKIWKGEWTLDLEKEKKRISIYLFFWGVRKGEKNIFRGFSHFSRKRLFRFWWNIAIQQSSMIPNT